MKQVADPNWKEVSYVNVLTKDNFTDFVNSHDLSLVEFYAPWCGHCKKLEPEFNDASKVLHDANEPIKLAKVDATVEKDLATQYNAQGFPTMKIFRKGKAYEYKGPRTSR